MSGRKAHAFPLQPPVVFPKKWAQAGGTDKPALVSILSVSCILSPNLTQALCKGHRPGPGALIKARGPVLFGWHSSVKAIALDCLQAGLILSSSATHTSSLLTQSSASELTCLAWKRFDFQPVIQTNMWVGVWLQFRVLGTSTWIPTDTPAHH